MSQTVFADSFYFLALLNDRDPAHGRAVEVSRRKGLLLVTTEFVLLELADALCQPHQRGEVVALWNVVQNDPAFRLAKGMDELLDRGREFYGKRSDKEWSLTDCISFVVMGDGNLTEALTGDRHFEQAGFIARLK